MTREEAAKILDPETTLDTYAKISYYGDFEGENVWQDAVNEACRMGAEALRALDAQEKQESFGEWVSVKDKMPEPNVIVLCCTNKGYVDTDSFGRYSKVFLRCDDMEGKVGQVIAWMPLPEPPKADVALEGGKDHA